MKATKFLLTFALLFCITVNAQKELKTKSLSEGTIENQFDYLIKKSNRYQEFKVVKQVWLHRIKKSVGDSLKTMRKELNTTKGVLIEKQSQIDKLTNTLDTTNKNVASLNNEKDNINFFGALISKTLYNTILWSIIASLLFALAIYVMRFSRSNTITKESKDRFDELEREYESHKHRSLEREQVLRRKLQDELNKQRKD
ncbi:MAG: tRNA (guanine-N1)-methyltransferase [Flavobacteriaceae bacterium]|nr:tRNA (guanine-N1)-methyltransferase [Flavobacteriaceae bacterium]